MAPRKDKDAAQRPEESLDYYRLLQLDPDAPQELIIEAYWYAATKLRSEHDSRKGVDKELATVNEAYTELVVTERREPYDAAQSRVIELRRKREALRASHSKVSLSARFLRHQREQVPLRLLDHYAVLCVDPAVDPPLVARAYAILRSLHRHTEDPLRTLEEMEEARSCLLDPMLRAEYDQRLIESSRPTSDTPPPEPAKTPGEPKPKRARVTLKKEKTPAATSTPGPKGPSRLRPLGRAAAYSARASGRAIAIAGRQGGRATVWTAKGAARASSAGARGLAGLFRQWQQRSARQVRSLDDSPDRRVLRDAAPALPRSAPSDDNETPCSAMLEVVEASGRKVEVPLRDRPLTLGSDDECDVVLEAIEGRASGAYAQVWCAGDHYIIRSLSPQYPALVDGSEVNWARLDDGDEIEVGTHRLFFRIIEPAGQVPEYLTANESTPIR